MFDRLPTAGVVSERSPQQYVVIVLCVLLVVPTGIVAVEFLDSLGRETAGERVASQASVPFEDREAVAPPANGTTVVTVQTFRRNFLVAFAPDGRVRYFENSLDRYHDVDPIPGETHTVEFVGAAYDGDTTYEVVRRVNLTTGETTEVYRHAVPRTDRTHRWHDVDRLDDHRLLVADIAHDAVFVVNTTTGERSYEWPAQAAYNLSSGGPFPRDWTHLNDVERLPDGRYLVSLRNQDSVVFLDPGAGIQASWTLGSDDDHSVLYEQHNPDFLPAATESRSGQPATGSLLVADSQNRRVIEYRRVGDRWVEQWTWTDDRMAWPRDADRLPNGHTLIGDTNSGRVLEVDERGAVVWQVGGLASYDVERLGTGDESTGGPTAAAANLESRTVDADDTVGSEVARVVGALIPGKLRNTAAFLAPLWLSPLGQSAAVVAVLSTLSLGVLFLVRRLRGNWQ